MTEELRCEWEDGIRKAFDALARYKFWMFGYHAARVVYVATIINRLGGPKLPNPFQALVFHARELYCRDCGDMKEANGHRCTSVSLAWQQQIEMLPGFAALPQGGNHAEED